MYVRVVKGDDSLVTMAGLGVTAAGMALTMPVLIVCAGIYILGAMTATAGTLKKLAPGAPHLAEAAGVHAAWEVERLNS